MGGRFSHSIESGLIRLFLMLNARITAAATRHALPLMILRPVSWVKMGGVVDFQVFGHGSIRVVVMGRTEGAWHGRVVFFLVRVEAGVVKEFLYVLVEGVDGGAGVDAG